MGLGDAARRQFALERGHGPRWAEEPGRVRSWTFFDLVAVAALVVFSAVRVGIGTDYREYTLIYNRVDTGDWLREIATAPQEVGFTLLMLVLKSVDPTPTTFFWVTSALTVVPVFAAIKQVSSRPVLAV